MGFKNICINGDFLCRNLTGIERFSFEVCTRLDKIIQKDSVSIYVPANAKFIPDFQNIKIIKSKVECKIFPLWEHFTFKKFLKKSHSIPLDFANVTPFGHPGIVFIHDIYAKLYPADFKLKKDRLIRAYMCLMYRYASRHAKCLITVSDFSRKQISMTYKVPVEKIHVIYNGWEHIQKVKSDDSIFKKYPELIKKQFYFCLGSLQKRKNLKWIAEYASKNLDEIFAISGKAISGMVSEDLECLKTLKNVILLGYVSDNEVKALYEACKAFVFPSYYEGFGIPPLEALSCGTPIVIGNAASLPELYGNCAHYIDCNDTNIKINDLLSVKTEAASVVLEKYTYQKAAESLKKLIF